MFLPQPLRSVNIWSDTDRLRKSLEPSILHFLTHTHNLVSWSFSPLIDTAYWLSKVNMTVNGINYHDTFFEFPDFTKIHGEPDSESLYKIRNELRANAKSVYSNLSDGAHGHLALVMTASLKWHLCAQYTQEQYLFLQQQQQHNRKFSVNIIRSNSVFSERLKASRRLSCNRLSNLLRLRT